MNRMMFPHWTASLSSPERLLQVCVKSKFGSPLTVDFLNWWLKNLKSRWKNHYYNANSSIVNLGERDQFVANELLRLGNIGEDAIHDIIFKVNRSNKRKTWLEPNHLKPWMQHTKPTYSISDCFLFWGIYVDGACAKNVLIELRENKSRVKTYDLTFHIVRLSHKRFTLKSPSGSDFAPELAPAQRNARFRNAKHCFWKVEREQSISKVSWWYFCSSYFSAAFSSSFSDSRFCWK